MSNDTSRMRKSHIDFIFSTLFLSHVHNFPYIHDVYAIIIDTPHLLVCPFGIERLKISVSLLNMLAPVVTIREPNFFAICIFCFAVVLYIIL